jgi:TatD DNase family protein
LTWDKNTLGELRELAMHPKVVAIGEIGLDYYRDRAPRDVQVRAFELQLELAAEIDLPVVIHLRNRSVEDRRAALDVLDLLTAWRAALDSSHSALVERPGLLHSYSDSLEAAKQAVQLNFWIGISGPVTFKKAEELRKIVKALPLERLLVETDAPFLTPHPYRGKRNEPAYVRFVTEKIAQVRELPIKTVADITTENAKRLFHWQVTR